MKDKTATLIRTDSSAPIYYKLRCSGIPSGKVWASAWVFKSTAFFGAEDGSGAYQLDLGSINIYTLRATLTKAADSAKLDWNDGFACPDAVGGIVNTLMPEPDPVIITTTTTTSLEEGVVIITTTTTTQAAPKIG